MGLLSFPIEKKKDNSSIRTMLLKDGCVNKAKEIGVQIITGVNLPNADLFGKIRNAIAHFHIQLEKDPYGKLSKVILRDGKN